MKVSVAIIGSGNVAFHLVKMFASYQIIKQIVVRNKEKASKLFSEFSIPIITEYSDLEKADIIIIASSDDSIQEISSALENTNSLVVHTSGSVPMNAIKQKNKGVFYPLQTFSIHRTLDYAEIPFFIEGNSHIHEEVLCQLAMVVSNKTQILSSEKRQYVHLAAVWANNFTNANYMIADTILKEHDLSFEILKPLIQETNSKIMEISPKKAQTGPAKRNDRKILKKQINLLSKNEKIMELYRLFSTIINQITHEKL